MRTLAEAVFRIDVERTELAKGGTPLPVTDIDIGCVEDGGGAVLYYEIDGNWYGAGFDLAAPIDPDKFNRNYYEAEALRLLQQQQQH